MPHHRNAGETVTSQSTCPDATAIRNRRRGGAAGAIRYGRECLEPQEPGAAGGSRGRGEGGLGRRADREVAPPFCGAEGRRLGRWPRPCLRVLRAGAAVGALRQRPLPGGAHSARRHVSVHRRRRADGALLRLRPAAQRRQLRSTEADASRNWLERRADQLKRQIDRLVNHLAKGIGDPHVLGSRSTQLHYQREEILAELVKAPSAFEVVTLHPAILKRYEGQLEFLQSALTERARSGDRECAEAIRELVETVTVYRDPSKPGAVEIEVSGRLNAVLGDRACPNGLKRLSGVVVAEEGLEPPTRGL